MNKQEILDMPAGKKINQLIWWKVFGMIPTPPNNDMNLLPDYSGESAPAWSVVEHIHKMIYEEKLKHVEDYNYLCLECLGYSSGYAASFDCLLDDEWYEDITNYKYSARGETAPLAICRAALLALIDMKNI